MIVRYDNLFMGVVNGVVYGLGCVEECGRVCVDWGVCGRGNVIECEGGDSTCTIIMGKRWWG